MRVLVIGHNVFCKTTNMGKTLSQFFGEIDDVEIAQFYIHSEIPTDGGVCRNYYRFTDKDAVKSIFRKKNIGKIFNAKDISVDAISRTDEGTIGNIYQIGRSRTPLIYILRNFVWNISRWKSKSLKNWINDFNPDLVFFASGDYSFMYRITNIIVKEYSIPLMVACFDDYYIFNKNSNKLLGRLQHMLFMKTVRKTMLLASSILTICEPMKIQYEKLFNKPCFTLYTSSIKKDIKKDECTKQISYIGGLGGGRDKQLVEMAKALRTNGNISLVKHIDIYSDEKNSEILRNIYDEKGIKFHGAISADDVNVVMEKSMAVIHTESFDPTIKNRVRYSISTKIAESIARGPCLIAYGPEGIASIDYLKSNSAGYVISNRAELSSALEKIINDSNLREQIVLNARKLASQNHDIQKNKVFFRSKLEEAIKLKEGAAIEDFTDQ